MPRSRASATATRLAVADSWRRWAGVKVGDENGEGALSKSSPRPGG